MPLRFDCPNCGADTVVYFPEKGDAYHCKSCGKAGIVPRHAQFVADTSKLPPKLRPPEIVEPPPGPDTTVPPLSSRGKRLIAKIIDMIFYSVSALLLMAIVNVVLGRGMFYSGDSPLLWWMLFGVYQIPGWVIQAYYLSKRGQSMGKMALEMKIVMIHNGRNGGFLPNVFLRDIVNLCIAFIPGYAFVDALMIFRKDRRCAHDLLAGTIVIDV